ncbi:hypothetical protein COB21_00235 [Candidatus Aerophobetes bacterium]|uniref:ABC3 transporter permease C-terminal domain-containing protein n=1 Tax=Aerophobetes bacterium TaxID=2030807 RepID=A0A2A4X8X2_UNCAE|nr:MAG: hypothetical protein COB21_00235 [Candidatus Aerophobetes bacterium]
MDTPVRFTHQNQTAPTSPLRGMALLQSFSSENTKSVETLTTISSEEFEHLYRMTLKEFGPNSDELKAIFSNIDLHKAQIRYLSTSLLTDLVKTGGHIPCYANQKANKISFLLIPDKNHDYTSESMVQGNIVFEEDILHFRDKTGKKQALSKTVSCYADAPLIFSIDRVQLPSSQNKSIFYQGSMTFHGKNFPLKTRAENCAVTDLSVKTHFTTPPAIEPPWAYFIEKQGSIKTHYPKSRDHFLPLVAPKGWKDKGYLFGDKGYLSYFATTLSSPQEQQLPFYIAGFYDPGISAVSSKSLLLPKPVVASISSTTEDSFYSSLSTNGFNIFFSDNKLTEQITQDLKKAFSEQGILPYFTFVPYYEYEFVKDLLQQFKSDQYLFSIVSLIILIVASTNVISMLVVMVNDRKKEIAILQSLGASKRSIGIIFTLVGGCIGLISTLIGVALAYLTLENLDSIIMLLSRLQGHDIFNEMFYGKSLSTTLSPNALKLALIATPLLSLIAGIIPALIACRVNPSKALKAEVS